VALPGSLESKRTAGSAMPHSVGLSISIAANSSHKLWKKMCARQVLY